MHRFANPLRYQRIADAVLPWASALAVGLSVLGLYLALIEAPPDYQQGEAYRIVSVAALRTLLRCPTRNCSPSWPHHSRSQPGTSCALLRCGPSSKVAAST
jgi:hypothetical protein